MDRPKLWDWVEGIDFAKPIPHITGNEFRDDNRNGSPDADEPTLAEWEIKITRLSSKSGDLAVLALAACTDLYGVAATLPYALS